MKADIVIPVCAPSVACYAAAQAAIRTCAAHTPDAHIVIAANNMPLEHYKDSLKRTVEGLKLTWVDYDEKPFNISKCYNHYFGLLTGDYFCAFTQDVIFYPHWLDNLIKAWEREPEYFVLSPWTFNHFRGDVVYRLLDAPEDKIVYEWPHCTAGLVFRRAKPFKFEENIPTAMDSDLYHYCNSNKLKFGIVYNSRVDHIGQVVQGDLGGWNKIMGNIPQQEADAIRLSEKWKLGLKA